MLKIGFHISIYGNIALAAKRAADIGCNTFQIFTRNPRSWRAKKLTDEEVRSFIDQVQTYGLNPIFSHMPYLSNLASPRNDVHSKSIKTLKDELERCRRLEIPYLVTHLGSHLGFGSKIGFDRIVRGINEAFEHGECGVTLLLENTAGTRNSIGSRFEEINRIIDNLNHPEYVGVCFDTSHGFAAGYDLRSKDAVAKTISEISHTLGFEKIKLVHLNDSAGGLGSKIDRHEHIGLGMIGEEGFRSIILSEFSRLPIIMETPKDYRRSDEENLMVVLKLAGLT
ncbi:MAG: deoxyribonuclease IV [Nitrososphaerota archaeon]|nr:deoxyribonuclease IV [Candidatus Bathyarchaeota archaeon]MDW8048498.1 deoxyribonuclease IV [Nitrososphaerota archaeon]